MWESFFDEHKDYVVTARFYENSNGFTVEELYQAFKARLLDEVRTEPSSGDDGKWLRLIDLA
jgi:hypothetical protein